MTAPRTPNCVSPARRLSAETTLVSDDAPYVAPMRFSLTRMSVLRVAGSEPIDGPCRRCRRSASGPGSSRLRGLRRHAERVRLRARGAVVAEDGDVGGAAAGRHHPHVLVVGAAVGGGLDDRDAGSGTSCRAVGASCEFGPPERLICSSPIVGSWSGRLLVAPVRTVVDCAE